MSSGHRAKRHLVTRIRKGDNLDVYTGRQMTPNEAMRLAGHRIPFNIYFFGKARLYKPKSKRWDQHATLFKFEVFDAGEYYRLSPNNSAYDISMAFGPGTKRIPKHPAFKRTISEAAAYHIAEKRLRIDEIRKRLKEATQELEDVYQSYVYPSGLDIETVEDYAQEFYRRGARSIRSRKKTERETEEGGLVP